MRLFFITIVTAGLLGCGTTSINGSDVSSDAPLSDAASDDTTALGSDTTSTDASGTDAASAEVTGTDAAVAETITSDSPWKGTLFINEIHAGGSKTPTVATDGDWFELYNVGAKDLDLSACKVGGLTNGLAGANPLPAGTQIAAGGFLVVYYNHVNLGVPVINAGIKSNGSMAIWDTSGLLVDSVDWKEGASPAGSTYDRAPDGSATWKTVSPPTPGQPNSK